MLLIIEGLDRCGKSTLVEYLRKQYFTSPDIIVHHSSSPPKVEDQNAWELQHYESLFQSSQMLIDDYSYNVIFDRFHLGAVVYGVKYRNANPSGIFEIDKRYLSSYSNAALILLTDEPEAIAARDDGDSLEKSVDEYRQTTESFLNAFEKSFCINKLRINITANGGFVNSIPTVIRFLDEQKRIR
jgi:thymidylate kinase